MAKVNVFGREYAGLSWIVYLPVSALFLYD